MISSLHSATISGTGFGSVSSRSSQFANGQERASASTTPLQAESQAASQTRESASAAASASAVRQLTPEQLQQVQQLAQTDRKVRAHEQAHLSAAADLVRGGASFGYETGPDNRRYAVSGEVSIDVSPARTPEETIAKAQRIRAAALAPADPSAQDNRVAALASRLEIGARIELATQARNESSGTASVVPIPSVENVAVRLYLDVAQRGSQVTQSGGGVDAFA